MSEDTLATIIAAGIIGFAVFGGIKCITCLSSSDDKKPAVVAESVQEKRNTEGRKDKEIQEKTAGSASVDEKIKLEAEIEARRMAKSIGLRAAGAQSGDSSPLYIPLQHNNTALENKATGTKVGLIFAQSIDEILRPAAQQPLQNISVVFAPRPIELNGVIQYAQFIPIFYKQKDGMCLEGFVPLTYVYAKEAGVQTKLIYLSDEAVERGLAKIKYKKLISGKMTRQWLVAPYAGQDKVPVNNNEIKADGMIEKNGINYDF